MSVLSRLLLLSATTLLLAGCAGYRLGPTNGTEPGEKSVRVSPFANQTLQPFLSDAVTSAVRKQIQKDGTFRLASRGDADVVVNGTILRYHRHELSFVPRDVLTVQDYRVSVVAQVTARETATGRIIFDRPLTNYTLVRIGSDITRAERQALPLLADELAKNVTALLVDGSW